MATTVHPGGSSQLRCCMGLLGGGASELEGYSELQDAVRRRHAQRQVSRRWLAGQGNNMCREAQKGARVNIGLCLCRAHVVDMVAGARFSEQSFQKASKTWVWRPHRCAFEHVLDDEARRRWGSLPALAVAHELASAELSVAD